MANMSSFLAPITRRLPAAMAKQGRDGLLFQRLFWGTLAGCLATILLAESPVLDTMELNLLEWRFKVAHELSSKLLGTTKSQDIVLVTYDDDDQFDLEAEPIDDGPSPVQQVLANLITTIQAGSPLLVVVDIDVAGKADPKLIEVFQKYRSNIVLALLGNLEDASDFPSVELRKACAACAYDHLLAEPNGLVCQMPMVAAAQEGTVNSPIFTYGHEVFDSLPKAVAALMASKGGIGPTVGQMPKFTQDDLPLYINFRGTKYDTYRATEVVNGEVAPSHFQGKVVIIGTKFTQKQDNTPAVRTPLAENVTHAQIQADAINTIHKNQIIHTFPRSILHHILLLAGGALGALASILRMGTRTTSFLCTSMVIVATTEVLFITSFIYVPIVPLLAVIMLAFIFGTLIYLDTDLRLRNKELAEAREAMQVRAEEERQRIAEDLHDETLPALSSVARMADKLSTELQDNPVPQEMRMKLDQAVVEMRRVINDLHPSVLETMGFKPALENLLVALERDMNIETSFKDGDQQDDYGLTQMTRLQLYRIVQEGLNNIQKHSHANEVELSIGLQEGHLVIKVTDNGRGIDPSKIRADSHGLLNIRQRAQLIGANVEWSKPVVYETGCELTLKIAVGTSDEDARGNL
ncbi:CHASE2 domain-containing protein [Candidatus Obscuribacterales bacterium]|nr:CHASE2 domain-containing protein [Candidatus Obscuribacterales bacterium]MBX3150821.1 CHASE2 domain-containing protein [Candidatus Obscuribacterales bacterium]